MGDPSGIGERIRLARERSGRNRNQMARQLGTSWQHVARWERGQTSPSPASLRKLSECLGVSVDYLLGDERAQPADAGDGHAAFEVFLRSYAPADLTEAEVRWLREAPFGSRTPSPGDYVDMLHRLRSGGDAASDGERAAPAKSGRQVRVDKQALLDELGIEES